MHTNRKNSPSRKQLKPDDPACDHKHAACLRKAHALFEQQHYPFHIIFLLKNMHRLPCLLWPNDMEADALSVCYPAATRIYYFILGYIRSYILLLIYLISDFFLQLTAEFADLLCLRAALLSKPLRLIMGDILHTGVLNIASLDYILDC